VVDGNGDARGYSWPPFVEGNSAALVHGAGSPAKVLPLAAAIRSALFGSLDCPEFVRAPKFASAVERWSQAEAIVTLLTGWLDEVGIGPAATEVMESEENESRPASGSARRRTRATRTEPVLAQLSRWQRTAAALRKELGLSPASYASLARDAGLAYRQQEDSLERMGATGRGIRAERAEMTAAGYTGMTVGRYRELKAAGALPPPG
jgi:hypothetical protein